MSGSRGGSAGALGATHRALLDGLADAVVVAGSDNRVLYLNRAAERLFGHEGGAHMPLVDLMPERFRSAHLAGFARYLDTAEGRIIGTPVRVPALRRDGTEVAVELTVSTYDAGSGPLFMAVIRDLTAHIELEREAAQAGPLRAVSQVAALLGHPQATEIGDVARPLLQVLTDSLGWTLSALWLADAHRDELVCVAVHDPAAPDDEWERLSHARTFRPGEGLPGRVWSSGEPAWVDDVVEDPNYPRAGIARRRGLRGAFAFPVLAGERAVGAVELYAPEVGDPNPALLAAIAVVGIHLGLFLERSRALTELRDQKAAAEAGQQAAVELAQTLQASLLPPLLPAIPHLDLAAHYRSGATGTVVGGDFYDVFALPDDGWGIVIGDVQGKGARAAVATALARYTIRAVVAHPHAAPDPLRELNQALHRHAEEANNRFVWEGVGCTACYLRVRPAPGSAAVEVACAGHPPPLLLRADGAVEPVTVPGALLGLIADDDLELGSCEVQLGPGDAVVLYTDGVVEARRGRELFGQGRLRDAVAPTAGQPAEVVARRIARSVLDFTDDRLRDDVAVVVLRVPPA